METAVRALLSLPSPPLPSPPLPSPPLPSPPLPSPPLPSHPSPPLPPISSSLPLPPPPPDLTRCEVLYDYTANQEDELTIEPGDIIDVTDQQDQDWWTGELNGRSGIFPASYVQEMS